MEALGKYIFPSARETKPLQPLSAERVNAARPPSGMNTTSDNTKPSEEDDEQEVRPSPQSSPIRRAKVDLFADYHPSNGSPKAGSMFSLPQSPSLPEFHALRSHVRTNSDVQGLVKRFEHLDVRDRDAESSERRKKHEAELRRAQIAREEAESDVMRLREEMRRLEKELDGGRDRERKVAKRLEVVMDDFAGARASHAAQVATYDKELRKARKEAFKSSSTVLKLQEELKGTRNTLRVTQSTLDLERQKLQSKEQERFEMEYRLIPVQEQVEKLTQQLKVVESEKEALIRTMQEEEVARIAAEGLIALPASQDPDDDLMSSPAKRSPRKQVPSPLSDDKENINVTTKKSFEAKKLAEELQRERMHREQAEELADFLRMECLFKCCEGRHPGPRKSHGLRLSLDAELAAGIERIRKDMEDILTPPATAAGEDMVQLEEIKVEDVMLLETVPVTNISEHEISQLDRSIKMRAETPPAYPSPDDQLREEAERAFNAVSPTPVLEQNDSSIEMVQTVPLQAASPITPISQDYQTTPFRQQPSIRTVTTTTTVPMHFTPISKPKLLSNPIEPPQSEDSESAIDDKAPSATPTFDRAAALAAIEYRRGRAKSIANGHATPRKQMLEGVKERRDISAPALGQKSIEGSVKARSGSASRRR